MKVKANYDIPSLCIKAGDVIEMHDVMAFNLIANGYAEKVPEKKATKE